VSTDLVLTTNNAARWKVHATTGVLTAQGGNKLISGVADPVAGTDAANRQWTLGLLSYHTFQWGNDSTPNFVTLATSYLTPGWGDAASDATERKILTPVPGTSLTVKITVTATTGPVGGSVVFTLRVNGADSALVVTLTAGSTAASTTTGVAVSAGDDISIKAVAGATVTVGAINACVALSLSHAIE
jgi:hypothetical protein